MTPETETPTKTLEQLRAEYDEATAEFNSVDEAHDAALEVLQDQIKHVREEFNRIYESVIAKWGAAKDRLTLADDVLRAAILAEYDAKVKLDPKTPKTLGHGCSVRVTEKLQYEDIAAVTWAETNAPYMIKRSVDAKAFAAAMESMDKMPAFVVVKETVTAVVKG